MPSRFSISLLVVITLLPLGLAPRASAQDQPTVFVHGFGSTGDTWKDAAARLDQRLATDSRTPTTTWRDGLGSQATELDSQVPSLAEAPIAVGHSNGGLVARQWSRQRPLKGLVTVGTPHGGAPFVNNLLTWGRFNIELYSRIASIVNAAARSNTDWWRWISSAAGALDFANSIASVSPTQILQSVGLAAGVPVLPQMAAGSAFLADLNSESNLSREAASLGRVTVASFHPNYYYGGPFWVLWPEGAPAIASALSASESILIFAATGILTVADIGDASAIDLAHAMLSLADWLHFYNDVWCRAISTPDMSRCWVSDGLVPAWSQVIPGASQALAFEGGPPHTRQTRGSDDVIHLALTNTFGVPARPEGHEGGDAGPGAPGGDGGADGGDAGTGDSTPAGETSGGGTDTSGGTGPGGPDDTGSGTPESDGAGAGAGTGPADGGGIRQPWRWRCRCRRRRWRRRCGRR